MNAMQTRYVLVVANHSRGALGTLERLGGGGVGTESGGSNDVVHMGSIGLHTTSATRKTAKLALRTPGVTRGSTRVIESVLKKVERGGCCGNEVRHTGLG